jgi:DNA polymerase-4
MNTRKQYIAHLDLDCFFVSVERIKNPQLKGKPVVVGGNASGRGVVSSASYEARTYGVHSAMPTAKALRLCPSLIVVSGSHQDYGEYSEKVYRRMLDFSPLIERSSIDELYMDFTGCEHLYGNDLPGLMHTVHRVIKKELSLPCSIALASNVYTAKIAVGKAKPDGVLVVPHGSEREFLAALSVEVLPGIGKKTAPILFRNGIKTVRDLQNCSLQELHSILGNSADHFYSMAMGQGPGIIESDEDRKSISRELTFSEDQTETHVLEQELFGLVEDVCFTARKKSMKGRTITLKLRYADFTTITRSRTIEATFDDAQVFTVARTLLIQNMKKTASVRLIGVRLSNFIGIEEGELDLFREPEKKTKVLQALDSIRIKYGDDIIHSGSV